MTKLNQTRNEIFRTDLRAFLETFPGEFTMEAARSLWARAKQLAFHAHRNQPAY